MKHLFVFLGLCLALNLNAQSPYEKGMNKAFSLWGEGKVTDASNLFERISNAEKKNWIPSYYVAYINVLTAFNVKDEAKLTSQLDKAQTYLDKAEAASPNNPEIIIIRALRNTAFIAFDGQKYGMTLSAKNAQLFEKALKLAPNNPRVILQKTEWDMGSARFFGKPIDPYCKDVAKTLAMFEKEKVTEKFAPSWGKTRAKQVLQQCSKSK